MTSCNHFYAEHGSNPDTKVESYEVWIGELKSKEKFTRHLMRKHRPVSAASIRDKEARPQQTQANQTLMLKFHECLSLSFHRGLSLTISNHIVDILSATFSRFVILDLKDCLSR